MKKWKLALVSIAVVVLFQAVVLVGQEVPVNPTGLKWDPNTEPDLAGYLIYEADVSNGHVKGQSWRSVNKDVTQYPFEPGHPYGTFYWKLTAIDLSGNESGFSNEVVAKFVDVVPPNPPAGCSTY